jgi:hypothetical protein
MGYSGGVAVFNSQDFVFDMDDFKQALRQRWTDVQIRDVSNGNIDFGMTIKGEFDSLVGSTITQSFVGWWSGHKELAEFCVWFRRYIPNMYQLLAWSSDFYNYFVVTNGATEEQIHAGLEGYRFDFEIVPLLKVQQPLQPFAERFKQTWQEHIGDLLPDSGGNGAWFLQAQQGHLEYEQGKIVFDDNDLRFAAHFAIWCRSQFDSDQKLTVRGGYYPKPETEVKTELTSRTTEDELYDFLMKSFPSEQP